MDDKKVMKVTRDKCPTDHRKIGRPKKKWSDNIS